MGCSASQASSVTEPTAPSQAPAADVRVLRAQALNAQGKTEKALTELNEVIKSHPDCARAYMERGQIRHGKKEWAEAVTDFTQAIKIQPNSIQGLHMRAQAHMELKIFDLALLDINKACSLDADNAQLRLLRMSVLKSRMAEHNALKGTPHVGDDDDDSEDAFAAVDTPKAQKQCMVCMDRERGCRLRPCMHAGLCADCAHDLKKRGHGCPICSGSIETVEVGQFMTTFAAEEAQSLAVLAAPHTSMSPPSTSRLARMSPSTSLLPTMSLGSQTHMPAVAEEGDIDTLAMMTVSPTNVTSDNAPAGGPLRAHSSASPPVDPVPLDVPLSQQQQHAETNSSARNSESPASIHLPGVPELTVRTRGSQPQSVSDSLDLGASMASLTSTSNPMVTSISLASWGEGSRRPTDGGQPQPLSGEQSQVLNTPDLASQISRQATAAVPVTTA